MALPLEFYETFEAGTKGNFDSESDPDHRLDFPHADQLYGVMPYLGAYCCRVNLTKYATTDAYLEEGVSWASGQTRYGRFRLFIGNDVQFGNDGDRVRVIVFYSSTSTSEAALTLARVDPFGIVIATEATSETSYVDNGLLKLAPGVWHTIEFVKTVSSSAGQVRIILSDVGQALANTGAEGTITKFRVGAIDLAGDVQGTLLIDDFMIDEDRLYHDDTAHNGALSGESLFFLQSGFAFLGSGYVEHITLVDGGSNDCTLKAYDADTAGELPIGALKESLKATSASSTIQSQSRGFKVRKGCYIELAGTNPQAIVRLGKVDNDRGM